MTEDQWVWVPFEVEKKFDGLRIDQFLARRLAGYSRSKVQKILLDARVLNGNRPAKANTRVRMNEQVRVAYLRRPEKPLDPQAAIPVLFEDDALIVVNKPADLLSHPTDKIVRHTVLGILRQMRPELPKLHLLHRLDRETSGVLALAKNPVVARAWTRQMERRQVHKEYLALIRGRPSPPEGVIDLPIGREGGEIKVRQWVNVPGAVPAVTRYRVVGPTKDRNSVVRCFPQTGRLHQIRVHLAAIGHPILGDPLYTGLGEAYRRLIAGKCTKSDRAALGFPRVALHAASLIFRHPTTQRWIRVEAPLPSDMERAISAKLLNE